MTLIPRSESITLCGDIVNSPQAGAINAEALGHLLHEAHLVLGSTVTSPGEQGTSAGIAASPSKCKAPFCSLLHTLEKEKH